MRFKEDQRKQKTCATISRPPPTALKKRFTLDCDLMSDPYGYNKKPTSTWLPIDVMHWISSVASHNGSKYEKIKMDKFNVSGNELLAMSEEDFRKLDPEFGKFLYDVFCLRNERLSGRDVINEEPKRPRGRPLGQGKVRKPKSKSRHLWEFLIELLADPMFCPSVIDWEDRAEGVFRIKQSDAVAKLWGESRKKKNMDYVKMSRLMRYYYKQKKLMPDKQRLVYKFGPDASGWQAAARRYPVHEHGMDNQQESHPGLVNGSPVR